MFSNAGIELERSASDQAHQFSNGGYWYDNSDKAELGDLLFFKGTYTPGDGREITHVGIYAGNNMMIHAGTEKVEMTPLHGYWKEHFKGVGSFKYLASKFNPEKARQNYRRLTQTSQTDGLPSTPSSSASPLPPSPPTTPQSEEPIHPSAPSLIPLESNNLDAIGRQFFSEWNIKLE